MLRRGGERDYRGIHGLYRVQSGRRCFQKAWIGQVIVNVIERAILFSQMLLMYYTGNGALTLNLNVQEVCSRLLSLVVYAVQESRKPFIIQSSGKFFFTNQPNLNRIPLNKMESIKENEERLKAEEKDIFKNSLKKEHFRIFSNPSLKHQARSESFLMKCLEIV